MTNDGLGTTRFYAGLWKAMGYVAIAIGLIAMIGGDQVEAGLVSVVGGLVFYGIGRIYARTASELSEVVGTLRQEYSSKDPQAK